MVAARVVQPGWRGCPFLNTERVILLARGLDQHDDEGPGVVGKPDRADALADAPVH